MEPRQFKVIIVGGSVAGLSLAKMLEKAGVDFVVLEAFSIIAPQIGASIGLLGNGMRILDQLGLYDSLSEAAPDFLRSATSRAKSGIIARHGGLDRLFLDRFGYQFVFMDRQTLIQLLFESITDKSKIQVGQRVMKVTPIDGGVEVLTNGGLTVKGDMLVGADGVHSTVRREMWRLAESLQPGYFPASISDTLVCEYACIFGISGPTGHFKGGDAVSVFREHYSCFVTGGPKGKVYWFMFSGLENPRIGKDIPRFTKEDEERLATKYKDLAIADGLFFGDLYAAKMFSVMTALEEGVFEKWHFGRMITIGDAAHKFHPLGAQGGNSAIESAAALANNLNKALQQETTISDAKLSELFERVQTLRIPRAKMMQKSSNTRQRLEAMETLFLRFVALKVLPCIGIELVFRRFYDTIAPAIKLDYLEVPRRSRLAPFHDELPARPKDRSISMITGIFVTMFGLAGLSWALRNQMALENIFVNSGSVATPITDGYVSAILSWSGVFERQASNATADFRISKLVSLAPKLDATQRLSTFYFSAMLIPYIMIWIVECIADRSFWSVRCPLIWNVWYSGFAITVPLHYLVSLLSHRSVRDFLPFSRPVSKFAARAILPAVLVGYLLPTIMVFLPFVDSSLRAKIAASWYLWPVYMGSVTLLLSQIYRRSDASSTSKIEQENGEALVYLKKAYLVACAIASLTHISTVYICLSSPAISLRQVFVPHLDTATDSLQEFTFNQFRLDMLIFVIGSLAWLVFSVGDIIRIGISTVSWCKATVLICMGSVIIGPGGTAAAVWYWREVVSSAVSHL